MQIQIVRKKIDHKASKAAPARLVTKAECLAPGWVMNRNDDGFTLSKAAKYRTLNRKKYVGKSKQLKRYAFIDWLMR